MLREISRLERQQRHRKSGNGEAPIRPVRQEYTLRVRGSDRRWTKNPQL